MKITNDVQVRNAPEGKHGVGVAPNLYLTVSPSGSRSWLFIYTSPNGKRRNMGLGSYPEVSLMSARTAAAEARLTVARGLDPLEVRRAAALPARRVLTFAELAADYIATHGRHWTAHYTSDVRSELERVGATKVAGRPFDARPVNEITRHDVACVMKIWREKAPAIAKRVRAQMANIFDFAIARELVQVNVAAKGPLDALIGKPHVKTRHHKAMPYEHVPAFLARLRESGRTGVRALAFLILTAMRRDEVREMTWREVDLTKRLWTVPAARMKGGEERIVPLSDAAMEILAEAKSGRLGRVADLVFPGRDGPLADSTLLETLQQMTGEDYTVHGFRSAFRDWAHRETSHPYDICEEALSHAYGSQVERAYRRGQAVSKVRVLLDDWARFCTRAPQDTNIIPLRRSA